MASPTVWTGRGFKAICFDSLKGVFIDLCLHTTGHGELTTSQDSNVQITCKVLFLLCTGATTSKLALSSVDSGHRSPPIVCRP